MKNPNILCVVATHIETDIGFGGVASTAATLISFWKKANAKMQTHLLTGVSDVYNPTLHSRIKVTTYNFYFFRRWGFSFDAIYKIYKFCKQDAYFYIHGVATWPNTLAAIFCSMRKRNYIVAVHGAFMPDHISFIKKNKPWKWLFYKYITLPSLNNAKFLVCTGKIEATSLSSFFDQKKIIIIPNGTMINKPRHWQAKKMTSPSESLNICYLGRISCEKGINEFMNYWIKSARKNDKLIIAGSLSTTKDNTDYVADFLSLVSKNPGKILYKGNVPKIDCKPIIKSSHFLVLPSGLKNKNVRENFGNCVVEALSLSRPVLVTSGLEWDNIEKDHLGFNFFPNGRNLESVLKKIMRMKKNIWLEYSKNSYKHSKKFDINIIAKKNFNLFKI